jgi:hypothetical protein
VKLFRCTPEKYKQITHLIEFLLDLSTMSIKEVIVHLKVVHGDEPQPLSGPITVGGKLHLTREKWEACQGDEKKGAPRLGREDVPRVAPAEVPMAAPPIKRSRHETTHATTVVSLAIGPKSIDNHDAARPTSHRWRRRSWLCSWHTQASSYLQWHQPQWLSSTLMNRELTPSLAMARATTRLTRGALTPVPPIT